MNRLRRDTGMELCEEPGDKVQAMRRLDLASDVATGQWRIVRFSTLLFEKGHQAGNQSPEAEDGLRGHELVVVTAQQVFGVLEEDFDLPTHGKSIDQRLQIFVQAGTAPETSVLQRCIQTGASD